MFRYFAALQQYVFYIFMCLYALRGGGGGGGLFIAWFRKAEAAKSTMNGNKDNRDVASLCEFTSLLP